VLQPYAHALYASIEHVYTDTARLSSAHQVREAVCATGARFFTHHLFAQPLLDAHLDAFIAFLYACLADPVPSVREVRTYL
jgi:hypothetical protein